MNNWRRRKKRGGLGKGAGQLITVISLGGGEFRQPYEMYRCGRITGSLAEVRQGGGRGAFFFSFWL